MPKYTENCSKAVKCEKCGWRFIPHVKDWRWHKQNCKYMSCIKLRLRDCRKSDLKEFRRYIEEWSKNNGV